MIPAELVPESFGLIHEYYTPTVIAEAIAVLLCPLLPELAGNDGIVRALEPSAGIGRLIRAFSPRRCLALEVGGQIKKIAWTAVEFSKVSSTLLRALRPDVDLYHMPMERWIREESPRFQGTISLVVANPPYGERGVMAREDPDPAYKEKRAYAYFMRRALDLLVPGGVGAFLVPAGFLSGNLNRELREKLLRRHHLLGAYRIPSHDRKGRDTVPGASVVMDLVIWRSRGGELTDIDPADEFIADGDYFKSFPAHILGTEDGSFSGDDEAGTARSWRYQVTGDFRGFPPLTPRPVCTSCVLTTIATGTAGTYQTVTAGGDTASVSVATSFAPRSSSASASAVTWWRSARTRPTRRPSSGPSCTPRSRTSPRRSATPGVEAAPRARRGPQVAGRPEDPGGLREDRRDRGGAARGAPHRAEVLGAARRRRRPGRGHLPAAAGPDGAAAHGVSRAPGRDPRRGRRARRPVRRRVEPGRRAVGPALPGRRVHDRQRAVGPPRSGAGPRRSKATSRRRCRCAACSTPSSRRCSTTSSTSAPSTATCPLPLVAGWLSATLNAKYGAVELERDGGFVQIRGHAYTGEEPPPMAPETLAFLGYYNHDPELFKPPQEKRDRDAGPMTREERAAKKQSLAERRIAWPRSGPTRSARGSRPTTSAASSSSTRTTASPAAASSRPTRPSRWTSPAGAPSRPSSSPTRSPGARRVLAQRGGLVAFDVGVGKTYTALAIIARARQEGWVRRPVILVPGSLVWKWHDDILCTLPDYRSR
jgi:hypothetical protein